MGIKVSSGSQLSDRSTRAGTAIEYEHHEVHAGDFYVTSYLAEGYADGAILALGFRTPNTAKWLHCIASATSSGLSFLRLREAATITDNTGSAQPVYNRNRNSANTSGVIDLSQNPDVPGQATRDPTYAAGTIVRQELLGGTRQTGATSRAEVEFMLKPNTDYIYELESGAAGNNMGLILNWYEHTDEN